MCLTVWCVSTHVYYKRVFFYSRYPRFHISAVLFQCQQQRKYIVSIFSPEDGGSIFLRYVGHLHTSPHGVTTQKTNIDIFIISNILLFPF